jgi:hypothetical protein
LLGEICGVLLGSAKSGGAVVNAGESGLWRRFWGELGARGDGMTLLGFARKRWRPVLWIGGGELAAGGT